MDTSSTLGSRCCLRLVSGEEGGCPRQRGAGSACHPLSPQPPSRSPLDQDRGLRSRLPTPCVKFCPVTEVTFQGCTGVCDLGLRYPHLCQRWSSVPDLRPRARRSSEGSRPAGEGWETPQGPVWLHAQGRSAPRDLESLLPNSPWQGQDSAAVQRNRPEAGESWELCLQAA